MPKPERPHISARAGETPPTSAPAKGPPAPQPVARSAGAFAGALERHPLLVVAALGISGALAPLVDALSSSHLHQSCVWTVGSSALIFATTAFVALHYATRLKSLSQRGFDALLRQGMALASQRLHADAPLNPTPLEARRARLRVWARAITAFSCCILITVSALTTFSALLTLFTHNPAWTFGGLRYFFGLVACAAALILVGPRFRREPRGVVQTWSSEDDTAAKFKRQP